MTKQKQIAILGAGESGTGAAVLAHSRGYAVFVSDYGPIKEKNKKKLNERGIPWEENTHSMDRILASDQVIKSPGIPWTVASVKAIQEKGISIIDEIEFASKYTRAKIIAITGSNGKTTTASLTYHILKRAGLNVGLGGNIGQSFAYQVATEEFDYYVLELSSFQLEATPTFKPYIAVVLNITPDHLDRYNFKFDAYAQAKMNICQSQTEADHLVYNFDDQVITKWLGSNTCKAQVHPFSMTSKVENGAYIKNNALITNVTKQTNNTEKSDFSQKPLIMKDELSLMGQHNVANSMASSVTARILDLRKEAVRESLTDFENVAHRLEPVNTVAGISFINDSKATNINAVWYALESMTQPVVWIAGGVDKGNNYEELIPLVKEKVKALVCLGKDNSKIMRAFHGIVPVHSTHDMKSAVGLANELADRDNQVLLSPACASFDLFDNYEHRGDLFKNAVRDL